MSSVPVRTGSKIMTYIICILFLRQNGIHWYEVDKACECITDAYIFKTTVSSVINLKIFKILQNLLIIFFWKLRFKIKRRSSNSCLLIRVITTVLSRTVQQVHAVCCCVAQSCTERTDRQRCHGYSNPSQHWVDILYPKARATHGTWTMLQTAFRTKVITRSDL